MSAYETYIRFAAQERAMAAEYMKDSESARKRAEWGIMEAERFERMAAELKRKSNADN